MKSRTHILAATLACVALAACDDKDELTDVGTTASVRFVNATSNVAGLSFAANGTASTVGQNVLFGAPTQCTDVTSGNATFGATLAGSTTAFGAPVTQTLVAGGNYTVIATGTSTSPSYLVLNDAAQAPTSGRARLRIINLTGGTTAADVFVTAPNAALGTAAATNIANRAGTTFLDVAAGQTQIRFTNTGTQTVTYTGTPITLTAGTTQTVVVAPGTTAGTFRTFTVTPCT